MKVLDKLTCDTGIFKDWSEVNKRLWEKQSSEVLKKESTFKREELETKKVGNKRKRPDENYCSIKHPGLL